MTPRYRPVWSELVRRYKIWDLVMQAYCGLPEPDGRSRQLVFDTRGDAEAWLLRAETLGLPLGCPADWQPGRLVS